MSITVPLPGIVQPPVTTSLTTTSKTDVFTASDKANEVVVSISVANKTASGVDVTLEWHDGSSDFIFWMKSVAAKTTEIVSDLPLALSSRHGNTQKIKATAGTGNAVSVTVVSAMDMAQQGR
ncbi:hypothetical protein ABWH97_13905 [Nitratireductor sp. ac15]